MKRFMEGRDRDQATLFPQRLDEAIGADNPVRVVDAFIDALDLEELGFDVTPEATGGPGYHPATMVKIYLYGYLNQVQSSRRLERECQRNLELIWLTGGLAPDFKTIADFRRDNGPAIRSVCRRFVALCRNLHLLDDTRVAIDGSKFKAVNNREKNFTHERLQRRMAAIDEGIARYLAELDRADRQAAVTGAPAPASIVAKLTGRIDKLKARMQSLTALEAKLVASGENQICVVAAAEEAHDAGHEGIPAADSGDARAVRSPHAGRQDARDLSTAGRPFRRAGGHHCAVRGGAESGLPQPAPVRRLRPV